MMIVTGAKGDRAGDGEGAAGGACGVGGARRDERLLLEVADRVQRGAEALAGGATLRAAGRHREGRHSTGSAGLKKLVNNAASRATIEDTPGRRHASR